MNYVLNQNKHVGTQANITHSDIITYESEDETRGRQRLKRGVPLYSKQDIREQYCISDRQVHVLENARQPASLFGCISSHNNESCSPGTSASLLSVCVRRKVPSDENLYELSRISPAEYAPFPRWKTPYPYPYVSHAQCMYLPYRNHLCYLRQYHPFHCQQWLSEEEDHSRPEPSPYRPTSFYANGPVPSCSQERRPQCNNYVEDQHIIRASATCPAHLHLPVHTPPTPTIPPPPPPPPASSVPPPPTTPKARHVSFAKSHTLTSFDDTVTTMSTSSTATGSEERLIDGRKVSEIGKDSPKVIVMETVKKIAMKTQATQTEVCLGRKPIEPAAFRLSSPKTMHKGAQTNGDKDILERKLFKSLSETVRKADGLREREEHELLIRSQSEEPSRVPFSFTSPKRYSQEIFINFGPQESSKKPLQKTCSDGEILRWKSVCDKDEVNSTVSDCEICYREMVENSQLRRQDSEENLSDKSCRSATSSRQLTASSSLEEEFHENLIFSDKLYQDESSSSSDSINEKVKTQDTALAGKPVSPAASNESLNMKDHSDSMWNESMTTVLQVQGDSDTTGGTPYSISDLSSPLTPNTAAAKRHLLLLQHQQRSSMDTEILENDDFFSEQNVQQKSLQQRSPLQEQKGRDRGAQREIEIAKVSSKDRNVPDWRKNDVTSEKISLTEDAGISCHSNTDHVQEPLARTDSGRTITDVSETSTTDGYVTATESTSGVAGLTQGHSVGTSSFESASSHFSYSKTDNSDDFNQMVPLVSSKNMDEKYEKICDNESTSGRSSSCGSYSVEEHAKKVPADKSLQEVPSEDVELQKPSKMSMKDNSRKRYGDEKQQLQAQQLKSQYRTEPVGVQNATSFEMECSYYIDKTTSYTMKNLLVDSSVMDNKHKLSSTGNHIRKDETRYQNESSSDECSCSKPGTVTARRKSADSKSTPIFIRSKKRSGIDDVSKRNAISPPSPKTSKDPRQPVHRDGTWHGRTHHKDESAKQAITIKAVSAESLRASSTLSDSVLYSEQARDHSTSCHQYRGRRETVEDSELDNIVKPPAEFEDAPKSIREKVAAGRLFKKQQKRYRSEEHRQGRSHGATARAKSEERAKERRSPRPLTKSTDTSMEKLGASRSSIGSDDDEWSGIYADSYSASSWVHVSDTDNVFPWCLTNSEDIDKNGHFISNSQKQIISSECTESENEFHKMYETVVNNIVHRKTSTELHKKLASGSFIHETRNIIIRRDTREYGFRIRGSRPVVVSVVEPSSPAANSGLQVGDVILYIDGYNVLNMSHSDVLLIFRECADDCMELKVAQTKDIIQTRKNSGSKCMKCGTIRKQIVRDRGVSWELRFFRLRQDNYLYYYRSELDTIPIGAVCISKYAVQRFEDDTQPYCFLVTKKDSKTLYLSTDTKEECESWMSAISNAAKFPTEQIVDGKSLEIPANSIVDYDYKGSLSTLMHHTGGQWKRQYCVLKNALLYFYADEYAQSAIGIAYLHGYKVQSSSSASRRHAFELLPPDTALRHFLFYTDSSIDKRRWMAALESSIERWIKII